VFFAVCIAANVWMNGAGVDAVALYVCNGVYEHEDNFMLAILATNVFAALWICMMCHTKLHDVFIMQQPRIADAPSLQ